MLVPLTAKSQFDNAWNVHYSMFLVQLIALERTGGLHKQIYSMNTSLSMYMYMYIHARDPSCRLKVKLWKLMKEDTKICQLKVELWKVM